MVMCTAYLPSQLCDAVLKLLNLLVLVHEGFILLGQLLQGFKRVLVCATSAGGVGSDSDWWAARPRGTCTQGMGFMASPPELGVSG